MSRAPAVRLKDLPESVRARIAPRQHVKKNRVLAKLREASAASQHESFYAMLRRARLPIPVTEHQFHDARRWRFDYAWVEQKIALEIEGGVWSKGRHTRGKGYIEDMSKYSEAAIAGWCVLRVVPTALTGKQTETWIRRAMKLRSAD